MSQARLPVHYDLRQLKVQAKELLRAIHRADVDALAELREHHPSPPPMERAKLADAQLVLARHYGAASWPRLVDSCRILDAIWDDDVEAIRTVIMRNPKLLHENAGIGNVNWGPPLSYAANVGRNDIIEALYALGAKDLDTRWAARCCRAAWRLPTSCTACSDRLVRPPTHWDRPRIR